MSSSPDEPRPRGRARSHGRSHASAAPRSPGWAGLAQSAVDFASQARAAASAVFAPPAAANPFRADSAAAHGAGAHAPPAPPAPSQSASASAEAPRQPSPFTEAQTSWLQAAVSDAVGASVGTFASHVAQRFAAIEEEVSSTRFEVAELDVKVARASAAAESAAASASSATAQSSEALGSCSELRASLDALAAQVEQLRTSPPAASDGGNRRLARIGALGWDEPPETLQARAIELLTAAGVQRSTYGPVAPIVGRQGVGSGAETLFDTPDALAHARIAVRSLRKTYSTGRPAWVDTARPRAETRPIRATHRLAEVLSDFESQRSDRAALHKDMAARAVSVGNQRMAFVASEGVRWTPAGVARYAQNLRDDVAAIVASA